MLFGISSNRCRLGHNPPMPIRPEYRWLYPIDWPLISREIRFVRAKGRCERCGRPHGSKISQLEDGRWYDEERNSWRNDGGEDAAWPDAVEFSRAVSKLIRLSAAHLDHDPSNSKLANLQALCQRCHLAHDRQEHLRQRRITHLLRRALGDLFKGPYRR